MRRFLQLSWHVNAGVPKNFSKSTFYVFDGINFVRDKSNQVVFVGASFRTISTDGGVLISYIKVIMSVRVTHFIFASNFCFHFCDPVLHPIVILVLFLLSK